VPKSGPFTNIRLASDRARDSESREIRFQNPLSEPIRKANPSLAYYLNKSSCYPASSIWSTVPSAAQAADSPCSRRPPRPRRGPWRCRRADARVRGQRSSPGDGGFEAYAGSIARVRHKPSLSAEIHRLTAGLIFREGWSCQRSAFPVQTGMQGPLPRRALLCSGELVPRTLTISAHDHAPSQACAWPRRRQHLAAKPTGATK